MLHDVSPALLRLRDGTYAQPVIRFRPLENFVVRLDANNPDWRNGPGTPEEQVLREHRFQWNVMLEYGLQPGQDAECFAIFGARDQRHAEESASVLAAKGLTAVEVRRSRGKFAFWWVTWWVDGTVMVPAISIEALDAAGLAWLGEAQELGCWFIGLCPSPQDDAEE